MKHISDNELFEKANQKLKGRSMTQERKKEVGMQVLMWAFGIYVTINTLVTSWFAQELVAHNSRLVSIESNRFTSKDGQEIYNKLHEMARALATLPKECPPTWFMRRFERLESRVEHMGEMIK